MPSFTDDLGSALWGLRSQPGRTALLSALLALGVASVVLVYSITSGFSAEIEALSFGSYRNAISITQSPATFGSEVGPTRREIHWLAESLPSVQSLATWNVGYARAQSRGHVRTIRVFGADGDFLKEVDTHFLKGRSFLDSEMVQSSRVCIAGNSLSKEFPGGSLRVNGIDCRLVGILDEPMSRPARRFDDALIVPAPMFSAIIERYGDDTQDRIDWATLFHSPDADHDRMKIDIDRQLRDRRGIRLAFQSPFEISDVGASIDEVRQQRALTSNLLIMMGSITIAGCALGFSATSGLAIASRRREIALRAAFGASLGSLARQLVAEMTLVGLAGSALGVIVGVLVSLAAAALWKWPFGFSGEAAVLVMLLGTFAGLLAGAVALRRVARVHPAVALKG